MAIYACTSCGTIFQAMPDMDEFLCPMPACRQRMKRPQSVPAPAADLSDRVRFLQARVWAAAVRDREGSNTSASTEAARLAGMVCDLLDLREVTAADNARAAIDGSLAVLVGSIVLSGVDWLPPRRPSRL